MADYPVLGNQLKREVYVSKTMTRWSLTWLPDDYYTNPEKKYPILFFQHGAGEAGLTESDVPKLNYNGPGYYIARGNKMEFKNPNSGELTKFIVMAVQNTNESFFKSPWYSWILDNDPLIKDRYDKSAVFATGLSLGAKTVHLMLVDQKEYAEPLKRFTAVIPMSSYLSDSEVREFTYNVAKSCDIKIFAMCGTAEDAKFQNGTKQLINSFKDKPEQLKAYWHNRSHTGWNIEYDPNWKDPETGFNIYEWMLSKIKVMSTTELHADAGANQTIMLPADTVKLVGTGSYGPEGLKHVWRQASGPAQGTMNNPNSIGVTISGLSVPGEYAFDLVLTAPDGRTDISRAIVTVLPDPDAEPGITVKVLNSRKGVLTVEGPALTESTVLKLGLVDLEYKVVN
ncbi:MAG: hypothetical protein M9904_02420 [Chitinophagaceae bacterium]|nr:hypothetical protein [Chitinophagaceae bacterium]